MIQCKCVAIKFTIIYNQKRMLKRQITVYKQQNGNC